MARTRIHGQQVTDGSIELVDLSSALASTISGKADAGNLAPVATSGSYNDLTNLPSLFSGDYADLTGKPVLFSGSYNDLADKPSLFDGNYSSLSGAPVLSTVATSGSYNDLSNLPTLFSGSYTDLSNKPTIPSALDDLSDVVVSSATKGQFIVHNGTSFVNSNTIEASGAAVKPLIVKGAASQSANLFEVQNNSGAALTTINSSGAITTPGLTCKGGAKFDTSSFGAPYSYTGDGSFNYEGHCHSFYGATNLHNMLIAGYGAKDALRIAYGSTSAMQVSQNGTSLNMSNFESWAVALTVNLGHASPNYIAKFQQLGVDKVAIGKQGNVTALGTGTFNAPTAANQALIAKGAASQTANLFEAQNSSGTALFSIDKDGSVAAGTVPVARVSGLAAVATSGSYNDLSDKPSIPSLTGYATQSYVDTKVADLVNSAPATLDTLNELATALGNDANFSTTVTNAIAAKADSASLATVATSGSYNDLSDKPSIPSIAGLATESYVDSAVAGKADSSSLATVATSGSYNDLVSKPKILAPVRDVFTSLVDGVETEFVLSQLPSDIGYIQVFLNGILQSEGEAEDYTIVIPPPSGPASVVFNSAPEAGWKLAVFYFV